MSRFGAMADVCRNPEAWLDQDHAACPAVCPSSTHSTLPTPPRNIPKLVIILLPLYHCVWSSSAKARPLHDLYHGMLLKSPVLTQKRGQCATRICSCDKPLRVRRIQDHLGDGCARIPFLFFFIVKSHEVVFGELCRTPTIGYCARFNICSRDVIISSYSCRIYSTR